MLRKMKKVVALLAAAAMMTSIFATTVWADAGDGDNTVPDWATVANATFLKADNTHLDAYGDISTDKTIFNFDERTHSTGIADYAVQGSPYSYYGQYTQSNGNVVKYNPLTGGIGGKSETDLSAFAEFKDIPENVGVSGNKVSIPKFTGKIGAELDTSSVTTAFSFYVKGDSAAPLYLTNAATQCDKNSSGTYTSVAGAKGYQGNILIFNPVDKSVKNGSYNLGSFYTDAWNTLQITLSKIENNTSSLKWIYTLNGKVIKEATFNANVSASQYLFRFVYFGMTFSAVSEDSTKLRNGFYAVDDIIGYYGSTISEFNSAFTSQYKTDDGLTYIDGNKNIFCANEVTVTQLIDEIKKKIQNCDISILTSELTEKTSGNVISGDIIQIVNEYQMYEYYPLSGNVLYNNNYDNATPTALADTQYNASSYPFKDEVGTYTSVVMGGVGGNLADDKSIGITTTNVPNDSYIDTAVGGYKVGDKYPNSKLDGTADISGMAARLPVLYGSVLSNNFGGANVHYTMQFQLFITGEQSDVTIWARTNKAGKVTTKGVCNLVYASSKDSTYYTGTNRVEIGRLEKNHWYTVAIDMDCSTGEYDFYVNGEKKTDNTKAKVFNGNALGRFEYITMVQHFYDDTSVDHKRSGSCYLNNFKVYLGSYIPTADGKLSGKGIDAAFGSNIIYTDMTDIDAFKAGLVNENNVKIYTDSTMSTEATTLAEGCYVVNTASDGLIRKYYVIYPKNAKVYGGIKTYVDGVENAALKSNSTLKASVRYFGNMVSADVPYKNNATLVIALYKGNDLVNVSYKQLGSKIFNYGNMEYEVSVGDVDDMTAKAFFIDDFDNMYPFAEAVDFN